MSLNQSLRPEAPLIKSACRENIVERRAHLSERGMLSVKAASENMKEASKLLSAHLHKLCKREQSNAPLKRSLREHEACI